MKKLEDLRFNLTKDMGYTLIYALKIKEKLENGKITSDKEILKLEKEFNTLKHTFISQFKQNNKKQIDLYNKIKKEEK